MPVICFKLIFPNKRMACKGIFICLIIVSLYANTHCDRWTNPPKRFSKLKSEAGIVGEQTEVSCFSDLLSYPASNEEEEQ